MKINTRVIKIAIVTLLLLAWAPMAAAQGFKLTAPSDSLVPGRLFRVGVYVDTGNTSIQSYSLRVGYPEKVALPLWVEDGDDASLYGFGRPVMKNLFLNGDLRIEENHEDDGACLGPTLGTYVHIADIVFIGLISMSSLDENTVDIRTVRHVYDCTGSLVTQLFLEKIDATLVVEKPPIGTDAGYDEYLDIDGDGALTATDAQILCEIVDGELANSMNLPLNLGGIQMDINGNGLVDKYDCGHLIGITYDHQFMSTGMDGVADTVAASGDLQKIQVGYGKPNAVAITDGGDGLETSPSGDDVVQGNNITTGPNGICDTMAAGNDSQDIPFGQGLAYATMITAGTDGVIDTSPPSGDDELHSFPKSPVNFLLDDPLPGQPAQLVRMFPLGNPTTVREKSLGSSEYWQVPLCVAVLDEDGTPKAGIAPEWVITLGNGVFDDGNLGTTLINSIPTDSFGVIGSYLEGMACVVFHPVEGSNQVAVSIPAEPEKGINSDLGPLYFDINALPYTQVPFPDEVTVNVNSSAYLGESVPINITLKETGTGVEGYADKIELYTDRNLLSGVTDRENRFETVNMIFKDQFETDCPGQGGSWIVTQGAGNIQCSTDIPGYFGLQSVNVSGAAFGGQTSFQQQGDLSQFKRINLGYQWGFIGDPDESAYMQVDYSTDGGSSWITVHHAEGRTGLNCFSGPLSCLTSYGYLETVRIDLSSDESADYNPNFMLRFTFNGALGDQFYLDNVVAGGVRILFKEDFESMTVGDAPTGFDYVDRVTSGADGICHSNADAQDVQLIPYGEGEPSSKCVLAGLNGAMDTPVGGDDINSVTAVNSGDNGICESEAQGDDFQNIPVGQGRPYSICISPGADQTLQTVLAWGDDVIQKTMGPNPNVVVDNTIGADGSSNQGHNLSSNFVKISRTVAGTEAEAYVLRKELDLEGYENVWLTAYTRTLGLANVGGAEPGQRWICEVSDNGGESFVPIWMAGAENEDTWTEHKVCLSCDPRVKMTDDFIVQWRAVMDSTEDDGVDPDAGYVDSISVAATESLPDIFGPVIDLGGGNYSSTITSLKEGDAQILAVVMSDSVPPIPPFNDPQPLINFSLNKVDPNSVRIIPEEFSVKACETMDFMVAGTLQGDPSGYLTDLTDLYTFVVNGPATIDEDGHMIMDCLEGFEPVTITVSAVPLVDGLYDPPAQGEGLQTGYIEGRVSQNIAPFNEITTASIGIDSGQYYFSDTSDVDGLYFRTSIPVGTYTVSAMKTSYTGEKDENILVTAGQTSTANLLLGSGSDTDGDGTADSADSDDDDDGVADSSESSGCQYDPDCDDDDVDDGSDPFPTDASEWADTDGDTVGDNSDADDDADGISDWEEENPGSDGWVTDPLLEDSDSDGLTDPEEINGTYGYYTNPNVADTDGGGREDGDEIALGRNPTNSSDDNSLPVGDAGADFYAILNDTTYLDGTATTDADDDTITYAWTHVAGPASISLTNDDEAQPSFTGTFPGEYTFRLRVYDFIGEGSLDEVEVDVSADTDGDGLSDNFELDISSTSVSNADGDGDTIPDRHDYYDDSTDAGTVDYACQPGLSCFLDTNDNGNGQYLIMSDDMLNMTNEVFGNTVNYAGLYPSDGSLLDVNGDGDTLSDDMLTYKLIIYGTTWTGNGVPNSLVTVPDPFVTPETAIGEMTTVTVEVTCANGAGRAGTGVVFTISGPGELVGGRGDATSYENPLDSGNNFPAGSRWAVTGTYQDGGHSYASIKVLRTGSGTITVNGIVPYYAKWSAKGLTSSLQFASPITIE